VSFIQPQSDESTGEIEYLGIKETCFSLVEFIESQKIITPMSIAIHGEWGSGKTNLLKALEKELHPEKIKVVFFDAWKHEANNPSVALTAKIMNELFGDKEIIRNVIKVAADALVRKTLNMGLDEITNRLSEGFRSSESLADVLEKRINTQIGDNTKLVVLIDDLDRCDIENTLQMLAMMKLFLDIKNCICVAAIDFHRVEQAWFAKYGIKKDDNKEWQEEGRQYLEKIFQIRVPIPYPNEDERTRYVTKIMKGLTSELIALFVSYGPANPRAIKRMINLISYRAIITKSDSREIISLLWTLLEDNIKPENLSTTYEQLEKELGFVQTITDLTKENYPNFVNKLTGFASGFTTKFRDGEHIERFFMTFQKILKKLPTALGQVNRDFDLLYSSSKELQSRGF